MTSAMMPGYGNQLMYSSYFAPRGRNRMYALGQQLSERYLSPLDRLIGIIGDAGAGKSSLVKGMFPGLELTNDDDGVNIRPLPLLKNIDRGFFSSHTYHVDIRFELAFTQIHELVEAVTLALAHNKRVIVEHFDLLYPMLKTNADVLIGVGGEVIVVRPTVFGPVPQEIRDVVVKTLQFRKMAHTAEDLTNRILVEEYGAILEFSHRDVHHGFVLEYPLELSADIKEVETKVKKLIDEGIAISYCDEGHIKIGDLSWSCSGPRTHVRNTEDIENFRLVPEYKYDPKTRTYLIIGLVGPRSDTLDGFTLLNTINC
ncbi:alanine-tRNA synthetase second additional domain-containing protein [Sporomusa sphaeroides DSM 2875]|uniref:alanine-tRNA synthetase second additional domain-containing protein n=1 Tax=Sporomusa sphaeroides TaxID=47679 RepID=UPI00202FFC0A|nr:alanine-tRNA synthetase second additional domain-containing protein [Sporomusa sphaeroides]MCM0758888.1 alanine-tRNA synthetase second additional domain-containing protein [Sporomusa sphaeroides DSM 2875]